MNVQELKFTTLKANSMNEQSQRQSYQNWKARTPEQVSNAIVAWRAMGCNSSLDFDTPTTLGYTTLDMSEPVMRKKFSARTHNFERIDMVQEADDAVKCRNFEYALVRRIVHLESPDVNAETTVKVELMLKNDGKRAVYPITVKVSDIPNLYSKIRAVYPQFYANNLDGFNEEAALKYRALCESANGTSYTYGFSGWWEINGRLHFLESSMGNVTSKYGLSFDKDKARAFLPLYWQVSPVSGNLLILLLVSCWASIDQLFSKAKLKERGFNAALYVSAPTGTGKTTLCTIFTKAFLKDGEEPCLRFEDTTASLEESIVSAKDVPVLVDDFYAQGSKNGDSAYEHKASAITRIAGDRLLRGKCGADRKPRPDRAYRGAIICTGEYIKLNTQSSYLRCWQIFFPKRSIEMGEALSVLSSDVTYAKSFMSGWIKYLEENQDNILQHLPTILKKHELTVAQSGLTGKYARLGANTAALLTVSEILCNYCNELLGYTDDYLQDIEKIILREAFHQLDELQELSPEEIWRKGFLECIDSGDLQLAENQIGFIESDYHGFYLSDGSIVCMASAVEKLILKYAYEHGYGLKITKSLLEELAERKIILTHCGEIKWKFTVQRSVTPVRPNMIAVNLNA